MCRNHSHAVVNQAIGGRSDLGSIVHIAQLTNPDFKLEIALTGETLTLPSCSTLVLLSIGPGTPSLSATHLMEVFLALLSVLETPDGEPGQGQPAKWKTA